ncbi:hypothetical protein DXV76_17960 [Rhodobacteraceae bacterium CCMM004]|nr:hypothetical protein DXV76_17960 [Rhodobacteraceae bacterium CCMM004]
MSIETTVRRVLGSEHVLSISTETSRNADGEWVAWIRIVLRDGGGNPAPSKMIALTDALWADLNAAEHAPFPVVSTVLESELEDRPAA